jgi:cysteine desulfurase/selenocysteine lyase
VAHLNNAGAVVENASNVIAYLQVARRTGAVVEVIEDDEYGQFSVADLKERLGRGPGGWTPSRPG